MLDIRNKDILSTRFTTGIEPLPRVSGARQRSRNTWQSLCRAFFSETHEKGRTTTFCHEKDLCRASCPARPVKKLCRASHVTYGKKKSKKKQLSALLFEMAAADFAVSWPGDVSF
jgi:hypothetical protein